MITGQAIKDRFEGRYEDFYRQYVKSLKALKNGEYIALCPFHDDHDPSLCVNNTTGQFNCFGCGFSGDIFTFYARVNDLDPKSQFKDVLEGISKDFGIGGHDSCEYKHESQGAAKKEVKPKIVAVYDYTNEKGELLFQKVRFEPGRDGRRKSFAIRRKDPDKPGKWIWNLKQTKEVPYRLPDVLDAGLVLIVEGEKDVQNLLKLKLGKGIAASTNAFGAGHWPKHFKQYFQGLETAVIIPDNDEPGRKHAEEIATNLKGVVKEIKVLELPGLPEKGDVSDWIEAGGTKEQLLQLIKECPEWKPKPSESKTQSPGRSIEDAIIEVDSLLSMQLPKKEVIVHPWLTQQSITLISGWRGIGKSWFAMALVDSITKGAGQHFGPWEVKTSVPCLYLDGEMVASDVQGRFLALQEDGGNEKKESPLYIYCDGYACELGLAKANLLDEEWRESMTEVLIKKKIKLWVIDNLASLSAGIDENSKAEWGPINDWLLKLRFSGISTVLVHHTGKTGTQRGTSGREDNVDTSILLKRPAAYKQEDGARFVISFEKARVPHEDLPLIRNVEFQFLKDERGQFVLTSTDAKRETRNEILRMLDEGIKNTDIADQLGISKGYVSQVRKQAVAQGILTSKGKLSQAGFCQVYA